MASILDLALLEPLAPIFIFLFVFALMFTVLEKLKVLGTNRGVNSLVAFAVAMLFLISSPAIEVVKVITPWFAVLLIIIMCILVVFMFIGIKADEIAAAVAQSGNVWMIIIILLILLAIAFTFVFGTDIASLTQEGADDSGFASAIWKIIFHPRILGVAFLVLVASQTVRLVAQGFT